jgi:hypothetical protein
MRIPGFGAEGSLYRSSGTYRASRSSTPSDPSLAPMAPLGVCLDILTTLAPFCGGDEQCICNIGSIAADCGGFPRPPCAATV